MPREPNNSFLVAQEGSPDLYLLVGYGDHGYEFPYPAKYAEVYVWKIHPVTRALSGPIGTFFLGAEQTVRFGFGGYVTGNGEIEIVTSPRRTTFDGWIFKSEDL